MQRINILNQNMIPPETKANIIRCINQSKYKSKYKYINGVGQANLSASIRKLLLERFLQYFIKNNLYKSKYGRDIPNFTIKKNINSKTAYIIEVNPEYPNRALFQHLSMADLEYNIYVIDQYEININKFIILLPYGSDKVLYRKNIIKNPYESSDIIYLMSKLNLYKDITNEYLNIVIDLINTYINKFNDGNLPVVIPGSFYINKVNMLMLESTLNIIIENRIRPEDIIKLSEGQRLI